MTSYWIVVVDDDTVYLNNARSLLSSQKMQVSTLHSGEELLSFMEKYHPDLILLDVFMPEMDGFETYRRLREFEEKEERINTPVIFLTQDDDTEIERHGLKIGASDFIKKPFDRGILIQRIHNIIANSRTIEHLTEKATTDRLTGFLNKASGSHRLKDICKNSTGALMIIDLDSFKLVNDLYGHEMGDRLLAEFANIMRRNTRSADVLCRVGGDEFMAFFRDITREVAVAALIQRLNMQLEKSGKELMGADHGIPIGVSAGCVMVPEHGVEYDWLFKLADRALYQVKQNGKHGYAIYNPNQEEDDATDLDKEMARITQVIEERTESVGALRLGIESFTWIYRFMLRFMQRYRETAVKLLFSLDIEETEKQMYLMEVVSRFGDMLQSTLRRSDIILQSRSNQYFLLLPEMTEDSVESVVRRIMERWRHEGDFEEIEISYTYECIDFSEETDGEKY